MLSYALAIAVAISSLILFSTAFVMSKIHRKDDFLWSAVGLFYALVLWYCAKNITGTVLLGQAAATVLIVSYSWQTIKLRRAIANPVQAPETKNFSVVQSINGLWKRGKDKFQPRAKPIEKAPKPKVTEQDIAIPETPTEISEAIAQETQDLAPDVAQDFKETNSPVAQEEVNIEDDQSWEEEEVAETATPELADNSRNQAAKPIATEPLPLPNKLPETAKIPETTTTGNDQTTPDHAASKPAKENIQFDSLETVEVAEVLEEDLARQKSDRAADQFNIIEVTTTDVNPNPETPKIDQNQENDADTHEA
jgi:Ycf66 protein N-terminus